MKNMKDECLEYAKRVANELYQYYIGIPGGPDEDDLTIYDYINEEVLDYNIILNSDKTLAGLRLYVTLGGPTCWIDTKLGEVVCSWGTERGEYKVDAAVCAEINAQMTDVLGFDW